MAYMMQPLAAALRFLRCGDFTRFQIAIQLRDDAVDINVATAILQFVYPQFKTVPTALHWPTPTAVREWKKI